MLNPFFFQLEQRLNPVASIDCQRVYTLVDRQDRELGEQQRRRRGRCICASWLADGFLFQAANYAFRPAASQNIPSSSLCT